MIDSRCHCSSMCRDLLVQPPAPVREHIRFHDAIPGQPSPLEPPAGLAARLGIFDATMVVMGGIVGSGIFINSYVVAKLVHTPAMILGAWVAGGLLALVGAFIYAELANRMPEVGGQYAYIREAYDPLLGFLYGWVSILVIHAGGTAAVAVTFGKYFREFSHSAVPENVAAVSVVVALTAINCLGVRAGSGVQSFFMVLRVLAIVMIVGCGAWFLLRSSVAPHPAWQPLLDRPASFDLLTVFGAALIPVIFAYGGWQTSNYIASEIREPRTNLPKALLLGVIGVIALYVSVNLVYVQALSPVGLAATSTPASAVMRAALGEAGAKLVAITIAISTLGFLSQAMLTYPRVAFAMAEDGVLPRAFARLGSRSRVPVAAIILQGAITSAAVMLGTFEQLLSYVVVMDWLFFGLTASCLFIFRRRQARKGNPPGATRGFRVPGHPWTTGLFVLVAWLIVLNTIYKYPRNAGVAVCILLAGVPVYYLLRGRVKRTAGSQ
ncbi:MAG TPA: amino acid permease [Candidatus Sulfotelmatobacter sp.]|nr:amino acid permease [Candidatus Sulfotelmatobacter sp.]